MQASRTFTFSGGEDQLIDCEPSVRGLPLEHEAEVGGGADLHLAGRPFRPSCVEAFGSEYPFLKMGVCPDFSRGVPFGKARVRSPSVFGSHPRRRRRYCRRPSCWSGPRARFEGSSTPRLQKPQTFL